MAKTRDKSGKFLPGKSGNPAGRPSAPNRITAHMREILAATLAGEIEQLPVRLAGLDDKQRIQALTNLLPYCMPRLHAIEPGELDLLNKVTELLAMSPDEKQARIIELQAKIKQK